MKSFISWIGGKNYLKKQIVAEFPKEYYRYVEVFGGAGWVLFHKEEKGFEIYNDLNSELVNLFRVVKHHSEEFIKECLYILNSRDFFEYAKENYQKEYLTDIQRAVSFFIVIRHSYGAKLGTYSADEGNRLNILEHIQKINERLAKVSIENLDYKDCIKRYDKDNTLFYLDPPYYKTEKYYKNVIFTIEDHEILHNILKDIKGKFVLSYNNCEEIKGLYKGFNIQEVSRSNNLAVYTKGEYKELIIKNF